MLGAPVINFFLSLYMHFLCLESLDGHESLVQFFKNKNLFQKYSAIYSPEQVFEIFYISQHLTYRREESRRHKLPEKLNFQDMIYHQFCPPQKLFYTQSEFNIKHINIRIYNLLVINEMFCFQLYYQFHLPSKLICLTVSKHV